MTEDLRLHESSSGASLNRNYFRPRFEDSDLEVAWVVERLETFRRVNRRAHPAGPTRSTRLLGPP
jgi:hypothetical protein